MLRLFRTLNPFSFLLAILYFCVVGFHFWQHPPPLNNAYTGYLEHLFFRQWWPLSESVILMITLALLFLAGLYLSVAAMRGRFHHNFSLLPAIVFYTLVFLIPSQSLSFTPVLLLFISCRIFLLIAGSYNLQRADGQMLDAGIWCGFMTLLNPITALLLVVIIIAFTNQRTVNLREVLILIIGWLVIQFLFATVLYLHGDLAILPDIYLESFNGWPVILPDWVSLVRMSIILLFLFCALWFIISRFNSQLIQFRRNIRVWLLFLTALAFLPLLQEGGHVAFAWLPCGPIAIFIAWWWNNMKNKEAAAILHLTLLGLVFVFQYINFAA